MEAWLIQKRNTSLLLQYALDLLTSFPSLHFAHNTAEATVSFQQRLYNYVLGRPAMTFSNNQQLPVLTFQMLYSLFASFLIVTTYHKDSMVCAVLIFTCTSLSWFDIFSQTMSWYFYFFNVLFKLSTYICINIILLMSFIFHSSYFLVLLTHYYVDELL